ncbi:MAG: hypothetical protein LBM04_06285, partial [Opitutaceae bacterium]|nr:hypothetical protein [Opitutaceae bacterium]
GNRFAALISARKTSICEEAFFVFFVAIGLLVWACSFGCGGAALGNPWLKNDFLKVPFIKSR